MRGAAERSQRAVGDTPYTLRVKIGDSEFTAEGPEDTVKEAYQKFLEAAATARPSGAPSGPQAETSEAGRPGEGVPRDLLKRAFIVGDDGIVSLRHLPSSEGSQQRADAAILLLFGFGAMAGMEDVPVTKLNEGLRQSGVSLKRLDRFIGLHGDLYRKGGSRSGGRYTLNNQGVQWAAERIREWYT
jgi:hypothetical protein